MTIKRVHAKAGAISEYAWYIILFFAWYLLTNLFSAEQLEWSGSPLASIWDWGLLFLVSPILLSGVIGGIYKAQKSREDLYENRFFSSIKAHFWRVFGANFLLYISLYVTLLVALLLAGVDDVNIEDSKFLFGALSVSLSAVSLFWFPAIIVERKIFRALIRALRMILSHPLALGLGLLWGAIGFADTLVFDINRDQIPVAINVVRSGVFAVLKILSLMYALAFYEMVRENFIDQVRGDEVHAGSPPREGNKFINVSFGLSFVSFIPVVHVAALVLGILSMKREKRFVVRSAIARWLGVFFTIFYILLAASFFIENSTANLSPGYEFLAEEKPEIGPYLDLLENGELEEFQQHLDTLSTNSPQPRWVFDCASALIKYQEADLDGAIADFQAAAVNNPRRSEFYFYYGLALLENGQNELALDQFKQARKFAPNSEISERYIALIENTYAPSILVSSVMTVIILLMLFALHEYGHAFAAWKLGDDTAKELGRLTLNPIAHLDIFGSIILPGLLLLQQSDLIFGWAKPVPVNPEKLQDPRTDQMRVSFAGPAVNFIVSMVSVILLGMILLTVRVLWPQSITLNISSPFSPLSLAGAPSSPLIVYVIVFLKRIFYLSLILGCFNLVPIPPLDGSWILAGLIPGQFRELLFSVRQYSYIIFLILFITPVFDYLLSIPVGAAWGLLDLMGWAMGFA